MTKHRAKREKKAKPKSTKGVQQSNEALVKKSGDLGAEQGVRGDGDAGGGERSSTPPVAAYKKGLKHRPRYTELEKSRLKAMIVKAMEKAFTVGVAAEAVGIARSTVIAWQDQDPEFKGQCEDKTETRLDKLEDKVIEATDNLNQPHKATLAMFHLNAYRRERFMPMTRHEHTGPGGGPVQVALLAKIKKMTDDELRAELAKLLGPALCVHPGEKSENE